MSGLLPAAIRVEQYHPGHTAAWDAFIGASTNGPFLFRRSYLNYHQDRFEDCSWLVWQGSRLQAVFVAGRPRDTATPALLIAHPGLAYGGLVTTESVKTLDILAWLDALRGAWQAAGYRQLLLKPVPRVFCRQPSDAVLFWLHQQGAHLAARELNSVIDLTRPFRIGTWRRGNLRKARHHGVAVSCTTADVDYAAFWELLTDNLAQNHNRRPVHTLAEICRLRDQNPANLELWVARLAETVVGGVLVFEDTRQGFVHTQYIAGSPTGKQVGAVDAVLAAVLRLKQPTYQRLSFGISTVQGVLNSGLLNQKEGFGATAETTDTYTLDL
ncbi:GNAT family N-acetyltransferase [Hymenobacter sp. BT190]|uniref:GNAT family N-acetyltransferase n=1 Tax=Hymenobacter sp. BT190 TaxID=2763505 RepID=UPI001651A68F|nr:GNAT family N-acetyltransferase [Hymenobacter sp. BT190]MBC6699303.1 GNAT family N-acetyltransferase [Hymenobacter sp. BT190]